MRRGLDADINDVEFGCPTRYLSIAVVGRRTSSGNNVVLHEFSHKLDMEDRVIDGTPRLANRGQYKRWQQVMSVEFIELRKGAEAGRRTLLDHYGATDEAEFFAVATECLFMRPVELQAKHRIFTSY